MPTARTALSYLDLGSLYEGAVAARAAAAQQGAAGPDDPGYLLRTQAENVIGIIDALRRDGLDPFWGTLIATGGKMLGYISNPKDSWPWISMNE